MTWSLMASKLLAFFSLSIYITYREKNNFQTYYFNTNWNLLEIYYLRPEGSIWLFHEYD